MGTPRPDLGGTPAMEEGRGRQGPGWRHQGPGWGARDGDTRDQDRGGGVRDRDGQRCQGPGWGWRHQGRGRQGRQGPGRRHRGPGRGRRRQGRGRRHQGRGHQGRGHIRGRRLPDHWDEPNGTNPDAIPSLAVSISSPETLRAPCHVHADRHVRAPARRSAAGRNPVLPINPPPPPGRRPCLHLHGAIGFQRRRVAARQV